MNAVPAASGDVKLIESLKPPQRSPLQTAGLIVIRCYLFAAIVLLAVRTIQMTMGAS